MKKSIILNTIIATIVLTYSCKSQEASIIGIWKPTTLILPESLKADANKSSFVNLAFETSKEINYNFHADGTFSFESEKEIPGIKDAKGTYTINEKTITINYNNSIQDNKIIKLTSTELQLQSKDNVVVVYTRIQKN